MPEIRLDIAEPDLDIANVETVIDGLSGSCYTLSGNFMRPLRYIEDCRRS